MKINLSNKILYLVAECGKPNTYACIKKMTEIKDEVLAFIGPDESCASEALVAAAWNIPLISYVRKKKQSIKYLNIFILII